MVASPFIPFTVLVSGAGSIGKRHARNLIDLGVERVVVCDPDAANRKGIQRDLSVQTHTNFEEALTETKPDITVICSPTKFHISQALLAAQTGTHLFIEKPLSYNMDGTEELEQEVAAKKIICMVGCNMRFHHGPAMVKNLMEEGRIGTVKHAEIYTGSFLPNWRPQQDYRKSYSADPLQGGAVLDCIHEIDLALWYLGSAVLEHAVVKPATSIGLAVDGTADITLKHKSGAMSQVHLSFTEPEYKRFCIVTGTNGVIKWDIRDNCVLLFSQKGEVSASYPEPRGYEFNWAYQEEISHFFRAIVQKTKPYGSLAEAKNALHIALQSRQCL